MSTVQLPGSIIFDSHMQIHTGNQKYCVSLSKQFQQHLTKEHRTNFVIDQGKYNKKFTERKWADIQYHVQDNGDVAQEDVKMY